MTLISLLEVWDLEIHCHSLAQPRGRDKAGRARRKELQQQQHLRQCLCPGALCRFCSCAYLHKLQPSPHLVKFYVLLVVLWPYLSWGRGNDGEMEWLAGAAAELLIESRCGHLLCWGKLRLSLMSNIQEDLFFSSNTLEISHWSHDTFVVISNLEETTKKE